MLFRSRPGGTQAGPLASALAGEALTAAAQRPALLAAYLRQQIARLTGVHDAGRVKESPDEARPGGLGLDSLCAVELAHCLEADLGLRCDAASLLRMASLGELRDALLARWDERAASSPPARAEARELPLSVGQTGLWVQEQLAPEIGRASCRERVFTAV